MFESVGVSGEKHVLAVEEVLGREEFAGLRDYDLDTLQRLAREHKWASELQMVSCCCHVIGVTVMMVVVMADTLQRLAREHKCGGQVMTSTVDIDYRYRPVIHR